MRQIYVLILSLISYTLFSQELPKMIREKIDFCDQNLSNEQATALRMELDELERYFIEEDFLKDSSGTSYRAVYESIAKGNDLVFDLEKRFPLLDSLGIDFTNGCFYKLLTQEEIEQLKPRHQVAAERITAEYDGDINPGLIAQRIIDNLTVTDFELKFYKISSLLSFYRIVSPSGLDLGFPDFTIDVDPEIQTIKVFLNDIDELEVNDKITSLEEAKKLIYQYIAVEPKIRGVEFSADRAALYQTFLDVNQMLISVYDDLKEEFGDIPRHIIFKK